MVYRGSGLLLSPPPAPDGLWVKDPQCAKPISPKKYRSKKITSYHSKGLKQLHIIGIAIMT